MDFFVEHAEVEVITSAEFGLGHYEVVSFSSDDYPDGSVAWFECVSFCAVFL